MGSMKRRSLDPSGSVSKKVQFGTLVDHWAFGGKNGMMKGDFT
jgi:hypothetical protein